MSSHSHHDDTLNLDQHSMTSESPATVARSDVDLEKGLSHNSEYLDRTEETTVLLPPTTSGGPIDSGKPLPPVVTIPTSPAIDVVPANINPLEILGETKPNLTSTRPDTPHSANLDQSRNPQTGPNVPFGPPTKAAMEMLPDPQSDIPVNLDQYVPFWKAYNEDADAQDTEIVESLGSDLDGLLIFAGLFSASNVAFIIESYKDLRPDSAESTNGLLRIIIRNQAGPNTVDDSRFSVSRRAVRVNGFFFASLSCSLFTAFGAVLGKQWLNHYKREGKRMTPAERGRERQKKFIGLEFWHLEQVVETLPTLLQLSLFFFLGALIDFLAPVNPIIAGIIAGFSFITFCFYVATTIIAVLAPSAPFQTRFTALIRDSGPFILRRFMQFSEWVKSVWTSIGIMYQTYRLNVSSFFTEGLILYISNIISPFLRVPREYLSPYFNRFLLSLQGVWARINIPSTIRERIAGVWTSLLLFKRHPTASVRGSHVDQESPEPAPDELVQDGFMVRVKNIFITPVRVGLHGVFEYLRTLVKRPSTSVPGTQVDEASSTSPQDELSCECISWLLSTSSVDQTLSLAATAALMLPETVWKKIEILHQVSSILRLVLRARAFESKVILAVPTDIVRAVLEPIHALVMTWDRTSEIVLPTLLNNDSFVTAFEYLLWKVVRAYPGDPKAAVWTMGILDHLGFTVEPHPQDFNILYRCILQTLTHQKHLHVVLGSVLLLEDSMDFASMIDLLKLPAEVDAYTIAVILQPLHGSVLIVEGYRFIRLLHPSARSFFTDYNRCQDPYFIVDPTLHHTTLTLHCIKHMSALLGRNLLGTENAVLLNEDISDLEAKLTNAGVSESLKYACCHWATHLQFSSPREQPLRESIKVFCDTKLLPWLEMMSLLNCYDDAIVQIKLAETWMRNADPSDATANLLQEMHRFAILFKGPATLCAAAIYSIALPLAYPSQLHGLYHEEGPSLKVLLIGQANFWTSVSRIISQHTRDINAIALTHDSRYIVSASNDCTIGLSTISGGACIRALEGHTDWVRSVALSPDSKTIISGSDDRTIQIWDTRTGSHKNTLEGHTGLIFSVNISPDSKYIVSGGYDRTVRLWNAKNGSHIATMEGHWDWVRAVVFSRDGRSILSGSDDTEIRIWDVASRSLTGKLEGHSGYVLSVVYSPDGKFIASGATDKTAKIWDAESYSIIHTLEGHTDYLLCVAFSPDSKLIVSGSSDTTIRVWDVHSGVVQAILDGHEGLVQTVAFTPDFKHIVSGSSDLSIRVWHWKDADHIPMKPSAGRTSPVAVMEFSPDGKLLALARNDGEVHIWDVVKRAHLVKLQGFSQIISSLTFTPDGNYIIGTTMDSEGMITIKWDLATQQIVPMPPPSIASASGSIKQIVQQETGLAVSEPPVEYRLTWEYGNLNAYRISQNDGSESKRVCRLPIPNVSTSRSRGYLLALGTNSGQVMMFDLSSIVSFESIFLKTDPPQEQPQEQIQEQDQE